MFLKPTAKPTPRRVPSPWVVLETPPGISRRSIGVLRARGGSGMRAQLLQQLAHRRRAVHDLAGRAGGRRCARALRTRRSTGSMPSAAASRSICDSWAKATWTAPKPRIAPHGGLLVYATTRVDAGVRDLVGPAGERRGVGRPPRCCWTRRRRRRARRGPARRPGARRGWRRARSSSTPGGGGRGRRTTPRASRPSSPGARCAARASPRGPASRGPRGRRRPRRRRPGAGASARAGSPRLAATWPWSTWSHWVAM